VSLTANSTETITFSFKKKNIEDYFVMGRAIITGLKDKNKKNISPLVLYYNPIST